MLGPKAIPSCHLFFVNKVLLEQSMLISLYMYMAAFTVQCQNWLVLIETIYPAKLEILPGPSQKKFTSLCLRDLEYGQTTSTMKLHSKQAASQNYFQNRMKTLSFSLWFSRGTIWSFSEATWCLMSQQTTCRSRHENTAVSP